MSFPFRLVLEFLGRSAVWLAVLAALAVLVGMGLAAIWGPDWRTVWKPCSAGAFAGALLAASLAHRFGLPSSFHFELWYRPLPPLWTMGGAVAGALIALVTWRQRRRRMTSPEPPD